ncbi:hypothetical protein T439DRAFT_326558 [Meredithblackwellia eburnea MCA 4105]
MSNKGTPMTSSDASRIQSASDRSGTNSDFAGRAQAAAANYANTGNYGHASGGGGGAKSSGGGQGGKSK